VEVDVHGVRTAPVRILVVEDDEGDVLMIREAFEGTGRPRALEVAGDGQEALDFLRIVVEGDPSRRPDVILLDLNMPRVDGHQTLAELKGDESLREIPVVVFTTSRQQSDVRAIYARHANAYVTKPVDLVGFTQAIERIDEFFTEIAALPSGRPVQL
jgi:CheY-like chemotaxis protein